jgi:hypothetical protein
MVLPFVAAAVAGGLLAWFSHVLDAVDRAEAS